MMRRAVAWCRDRSGMSLEQFRELRGPALDKFRAWCLAVSQDMRYDQLRYFRPMPHQTRFWSLPGDRRGILAANRVGKTVSTCVELAYHLTGRYPTDWPGRRWSAPVDAMIAGEGWGQVAKVVQNELMGTPDVRGGDLGTGCIPRHCIIQESMRSEGANVMSVEIRHESGGSSRLTFANYTQEVRQLQGLKLDIAVFDEQPPDDFFSEVVTRTATTQGMVMCSFTPLKGLTGLVSRFWNRETGYDFVRVSWDDVPELDPWGEPFLLEATRQQLSRDYLPYEREARMQGRPVMGQGAVFALPNWPTYNTLPTNHTSLQRVISLDLGLIRDSTVISFLFWDPLEQRAWLHRQISMQGQDEANPVNWAQHLMRPEVWGTPIVLPADASQPGRYTMSPASVRETLEGYGLNVWPRPIQNPPDLAGRITNHRSFGVNVMRQWLEAGTLQINENCQAFLREAQNYHVDEQGRFSDPDDHIDSCRYGILACLAGIPELPNPHSPQARLAQARQQLAQARQRPAGPEWRRTQG